MTPTLTILSWNIQGETIKNDAKLMRQIDCIGAYIDLPAVVCLQAVNCEQTDRRAWNKDFTTLFPEKILVAQIDSSTCNGGSAPQLLEVWNIGIIFGSGAWGEEKINALETVAGRVEYLTSTTNQHLIVAGDFNAPFQEVSETEILPHGQNKPAYARSSFYGPPFFFQNSDGVLEPMTFSKLWQLAEQRLFDPSIDIGIRDAYWVANESPRLPSTDDHSHVVHSATPSHKRLDHILVSENIDVLICRYHQSALAQGLSDHAPVVTRVRLTPPPSH